MDLRHESPLPMLGLLPEVLGKALEVLDPGALHGAELVVVRLVRTTGVIRAAAAAHGVEGVPFRAVGDEVAGITTPKAARLGAMLLAHPPVIHASDAVVEQAELFISQSVELLL